MNDADQTLRLLAHYPLTLAFENAQENDYATEKLYRPLACGVVPVVRGTPNVRDLVPDPEAIIDIADFDSVEALGDHLARLLADPDALLEHLHWRQRCRSAAFDRLATTGAQAPIGRLARKAAHGCGPECDCGGRLARAGRAWVKRPTTSPRGALVSLGTDIACRRAVHEDPDVVHVANTWLGFNPVV